MRVALVHDWLVAQRGGENVLAALADRFPEAPIYTLIHRPGTVAKSIEQHPIITSFVQHLPGDFRKYLPLFPRAPAAPPPAPPPPPPPPAPRAAPAAPPWAPALPPPTPPSPARAPPPPPPPAPPHPPPRPHLRPPLPAGDPPCAPPVKE